MRALTKVLKVFEIALLEFFGLMAGSLLLAFIGPPFVLSIIFLLLFILVVILLTIKVGLLDDGV